MAAALLLANMWLLGSPVNEMLLLAGAAGAFLVYVVDRNFGWRLEDDLNWQRVQGSAVPGSIIALMILAVIAMLAAIAILAVQAPIAHALPLHVWLAGAAAGALGLWYALPTRWSLKRLLGRARSPLIAIVWGMGVVVLPALTAETVPWLLVLLLGAYRAIWLLPNVLAAEYVDRAGDVAAGNPGLTASWTRAHLHRANVATGAAAVLVGTATAAALVLGGGATSGGGAAGGLAGGGAATSAAALWLALDLAGLGAQVFLTRPGARLDRRRVFELDLIAVWPVIAAAIVSGL